MSALARASLLLLTLVHVYGQREECSSQRTCTGCITYHSSCAWCSDEVLPDGVTQRCGKVDSLNITCRKVEYPQGHHVVLQRLPLSGVVEPESQEVPIQLTPQRFSIHLRPNVAQKFDVSFQQAQDYPMDLYYLMDLSYSMKDDKAKLESLGSKLAQEMNRITRNFRVGFGSFVDKKLLPFAQTHPALRDRPCPSCASPYGFVNNMALSRETHRFEEEVRRAEISGNLDKPEGGLDALMQATVCKEEIGWRNASRKIAVLSTDAAYHMGGDGLLVGIPEPHDGLCHLDSRGTYTASTTQDYPTLSQLKAALDREKVHVIFAVTQSQQRVYQRLKSRLGSGSVGGLTHDSSNVVDLIRSEYEKITSMVELQHNAPPYIRLTFHSSCTDGVRRQTNMCSGLKVDTKVTFEVEIELLSCPSPQEQVSSFQIFPPGLSDSVTVDLKELCSCQCELPQHLVHNSSLCSGVRGALRCGVCQCYEGWSGDQCQCDVNEVDPNQDTNVCTRRDGEKVCSGRGICQCGRCICHQNPPFEVSGKYCEYDNFSCDKASNGLVCGGPGNGRCGRDGICECLAGFTGDDCTCSTSQDLCLGRNQKMCGGNGKCECNSCVCSGPEYSGPTCEDCFGCAGQCDLIQPCVLCEVFPAQEGKTECGPNCTYVITPVDKLDELATNEDLKSCRYFEEKNCQYSFLYKVESSGNHLVYAQRTKECYKTNYLMVILAPTGGTVILGLLGVFLYKLITMVQDHKEYARFKKEQDLRKWSQGNNPLYKGVVSTFQNPTFRQSSKPKVTAT